MAEQSVNNQYYAGADWVAKVTKQQMSELGKEVANLLGNLYAGIYHIQRPAIKADWTNNNWIEIVVRSDSFATYDLDLLTRLVVLCHDACLRCQLDARAPGYIRLMFHRRKRAGSIFERHPSIEDAIKKIRGDYGRTD
jgi:hypothetical protein